MALTTPSASSSYWKTVSVPTSPPGTSAVLRKVRPSSMHRRLTCGTLDLPPRRSPPELPRPGREGHAALARPRRLPGVGAPPRGRRAVGLLRGSADRERPARLAPRPQPRLQGHL